MTSPDRLQQLVEKHLQIEPVSGSQMISLRNVPAYSYPDEAVTTQRFALDQLVSAVLTDDNILPEDDGHDE